MLQYRIAEGCGPTGRIIERLVGPVNRDAVVCWGAPYQGNLPSLNRNCSRFNKLQQLQQLQRSEILTVPVFETLPQGAENYPLMGRNLRHHGGLDIALIMQPGDAQLYRSDYYTRYIPRDTEFRTWVYRRRHLGTYEKVLRYPERNRRRQRLGANFRNGFAFTLVPGETVPEGLRDIASRAVEALGLDFGAVDVLRGLDQRLYVLEVNTAPGVEGEDRFAIRALAEKIQRWSNLNFPRRNGDRDAVGS